MEGKDNCPGPEEYVVSKCTEKIIHPEIQVPLAQSLLLQLPPHGVRELTYF